MLITFTVLPDRARQRRVVKAQMWRRFRVLRSFGVFWLPAVICLIYGLEHSSWGWVVSGYLFLAIGTYLFDLPRKVVRNALKAQAHWLSMPSTATITDQEIVLSNAVCTMTLQWSGIAEVEDTHGVFVGRDPSKYPRFAFSQDCLAPSDVATLRTFLATRSLTPAEYRVG